jgi:hypothetical protein
MTSRPRRRPGRSPLPDDPAARWAWLLVRLRVGHPELWLALRRANKILHTTPLPDDPALAAELGEAIGTALYRLAVGNEKRSARVAISASCLYLGIPVMY